MLAKILGPEGVGLMMMAMPLTGLLIILTTLGFPLAISKLVAEAEIKETSSVSKDSGRFLNNDFIIKHRYYDWSIFIYFLEGQFEARMSTHFHLNKIKI
ncbi:oligosaccharide flippase family protein [Bacillus sp. N9]